MQVRAQTLEAYVERADYILYALQPQYTATEAFETIWDRMVFELEAIEKKPDGDKQMEFAEYNTRYPFYNTIPGLIAETIAAVNLYFQYGWPIKFATDRESQHKNGIDFWINPTNQNHTVQVKAVRLTKGKLDGKTDLSNINTDWVSLVDIDNYQHFFIEYTKFASMLTDHVDITEEVLIASSSHVFDNMYWYGSHEDRLVRRLQDK